MGDGRTPEQLAQALVDLEAWRDNFATIYEAKQEEERLWKHHVEQALRTLEAGTGSEGKKGGSDKHMKKRMEPEEFKGDGFEQWAWGTKQYIELCHPTKGLRVMKWAEGLTGEPSPGEMERVTGITEDDEVVKELWTLMYSKMKHQEGINIVRRLGEKGQNGVELYRELKEHFDPESVITVQALRNQLHRVPRCRKLGDVLGELTKCEVKIAKLENMEKRAFSAQDRILLLRDLVPKEIDEEIEKNPALAQDYIQLKTYVTGLCRRHAEREMRTSRTPAKKDDGGPKDMDVDSVEGIKEQMKGLADAIHQLSQGGDMDALGKGGWGGGGYGKAKGKGKGKGKGEGKGKGNGKGGSQTWTGGKGSGKGGEKGKGQAPTTEFQGYCSWCEKWGHTARYCKDKDAYYDNLRKQQSSLNDEDENGEQEEEGDEGEEQFALEDEQSDNADLETVATMQEYMGYDKVECTMDSGSVVSIMPTKICKQVATVPSRASKAGKRYSSASGHSIDNEGESKVKFLTSNEEKRKIEFQRGNTTRTLGSIGCICDKGNTVIMNSKGGYVLKDKDNSIYKNAAKEAKVKTEFDRRRGVYVMDMWIKNAFDQKNKEVDDDSMDVGALMKDKWTKVPKGGSKPTARVAGKVTFTRQER